MSGEIIQKMKHLYDVLITKIFNDGYDGLTVRTVAELAGIHHSTLYRHFKDIDDIYESLEYYYLALINENIAQREEPTLTYESTYSFMQFVYDTKEYYYVLTQKQSFRNKLVSRFDDGFDVNFYQSKSNSDSDYLNYFMLIGSLALIDFWIEAGCKESVEHISKLIFDTCVAIVDMHHKKIDNGEK